MRLTVRRARSPSSSTPPSCIRALRSTSAAMTSAATERTTLLGLPRPALEAFVAPLGGKPFRARQLMNWMYKRGVGSFADMTGLAKDFAPRPPRAEGRAPDILSVQHSGAGTRKWLLRADASQAFEMVFIPEPDRGTL